MPGFDGLQTQQRLRELAWSVPVIIVTGHGDLSSAVNAMKAGAVDVLEKPYDHAALLETVMRATAADDRQRREDAAREDVAQRFAKLTPRQRTVAMLIADGLSNRAIAFRLGLSHKTVEVHRANLMRTLQASNTAHLVRLLSAVPEVSGTT
jgi:FixJ family two-component response regulator